MTFCSKNILQYDASMVFRRGTHNNNAVAVKVGSGAHVRFTIFLHCHILRKGFDDSHEFRVTWIAVIHERQFQQIVTDSIHGDNESVQVRTIRNVHGMEPNIA